jgi:hypothetical protein
MTTVLVIITFASLAIAAGMSVVVLRMVREERQRSDARASALAELASRDDYDREPLEVPPVGPARRISEPAPKRVPPPIIPESIVEDGRDLDLHRHVATGSELFAQPERSSPWPGRAVVIGGLAVVAACVGLLLLPSRHASTTAAANTANQPAPLELISLKHTQEQNALTISGLVQNPRNGATLSQITATAFLFSADGTFLTSGRAPLDFTALAAGDESPFVINVPVTGAVARYRVSFRDQTGRVIGHIDHRSNAAVARVE